MKLCVPLFLGAAVVALTSGAAFAQHRHHRLVTHHRYGYVHYQNALGEYVRPLRYESSAPYYRKSFETPPLPYVPRGDSPSAIVLRHTIEAQSEPGLATELAPDAKETATGGPVGGIPGFSGGMGR